MHAAVVGNEGVPAGSEGDEKEERLLNKRPAG